jgi:integrase
MRDAIREHAVQVAEERRIIEEGREVGLTFADAAERWYERAERRGRKRATLRDYRQALDAYLLPESGDQTDDRRKVKRRLKIERCPFAGWELDELRGRKGTKALRDWFADMPRGRTRDKIFMVTRAIFAFAIAEGWLTENVALRVDRDGMTHDGSYDFYSTAEVARLIKVAEQVPPDEGDHEDKPADDDARMRATHDAALIATAALSGLRQGELIALQWRDVDIDGAKITVRANVSFGERVTPKSGRVRVVPMVPALASRLLALKDDRDGLWTHDTDLVFPNSVGTFQDPARLRRRYVAIVKRAELRQLPFHSLRHHFGSQAVTVASLPQVQAWMGHSAIQTTARYLHAKDRIEDAELLAGGFTLTDAERALSAV